MRKLFLGLISIMTITILWINVKLYSENATAIEGRTDVIHQLNFLEDELHTRQLGDRMQAIFPEGFVFVNALYGLTWCELAISDSSNKNLHARALREAMFAFHEIDSDKASSTFDSRLVPENGIYYLGWKNYLVSKILALDTTFADYDRYKNAFTEQCDIIIKTQKQNGHPYLQSYDGQAWPADMCVAIASVRNYDRIFGPRYEKEIVSWVESVKHRLDPETKMIPHKVDSRTGYPIEGVRGSSIGLVIRMLSEIDSAFAIEQYQRYKTSFVSKTFGLPSISEYPKGQSGTGDVDSGPVIFGVGFSGTIVSIGTFSIMGDLESAQRQYQTITAFGFTHTTGNEKKYVFGLMPIADAFIAWGRSSALNAKSLHKSPANNWRIIFHLFSASILIILWLPFYFKSLLTKIKSGLGEGSSSGLP